MLQTSNDGNIDVNAHIRVNRIGHVLIVFFLSVIAIFYFSYTDTYTIEERPRIFKIRTNNGNKDNPIYSKVYVHPGLTVPGISIQLNNELVLNVETSRLDFTNDNCTLGWEYIDSSSLSFHTKNVKYGLISISAAEIPGHVRTKDKVFTYIGLIRAEKDYCKTHDSKSWTCQSDYYGTHGFYDSSYCIVAVKSNELSDILKVSTDIVNKKVLGENEFIGMFCANPIIQRLACSTDDLYFINRRMEHEEEDSNTYLVCKYSFESTEISQCYDTKLALPSTSIPIALMYDNFSKVLCTITYNEYNTLDILTYDTTGLTFKSMFKYTPSPSGWFITMGESSRGKLIFTGDAAPFEVLAIYDIKNTEEMYHNIYL